MTNADVTRAKFSKLWGIPPVTLQLLISLAKRACVQNTRASNGDPHPISPNAEKRRASELWGYDLDQTTNEIATLVKPYGFTEVVYTGLRPTLKRGEEYIEIPE